MTGEQLWDFFLQVQWEIHPDTQKGLNMPWEEIPEGVQAVWVKAGEGLTPAPAVFMDAWKPFYDAGWRYGADELEGVELGFNIAHGATPDKPFR